MIPSFMIVQPGTWVNKNIRSQSDAVQESDPNSLRTHIVL
jgi:hypothetical protein